jgi:hypothetical protein
MSVITYDCEFLEDGNTIDLISIGIVNITTGEEYYAVSKDFDTYRVVRDKWLMDNVMSSIEHSLIYADSRPEPIDLFVTGDNAKYRKDIARDIEAFFSEGVELWAYYGDYDHVALSQLWGKMVDLPPHFPMYTNDIKTLWQLAGRPDLPKQISGNHNALDDARHAAEVYRYLMGILSSGLLLAT